MNNQTEQLLVRVDEALADLALYMIDLQMRVDLLEAKKKPEIDWIEKLDLEAEALKPYIQNNVPRQKRNRKTYYHYPLGAMKVGESFGLAGEKANETLHHASMKYISHGMRFSIRSQYDECGRRISAMIWRIA